jgi:hypothetical protein
MKYNPDLQLEVLKKKFGLNLNWVEVDYLTGVKTSPVKQENKGVHVVCKACNGAGETKQDVNLLMVEASFAIWHNGHMTPNRCEACSKDKLCKTAQKRYDEVMDKYKKLGSKMEMATCPKCMGMGSYTQYKGYRFGTEK